MADHQGVAVGRRLGDGARPDGTAGPGAVLDHELLAERLAHMLGDEPRQNIVAAAGGERHHHGDRPGGIDLGSRRGVT